MQLSKLTELISHLQHQLLNDAQTDRRLFHGRGRTVEGLEQICVDLIQKQLLIALFKPQSQIFIDTLNQQLVTQFSDLDLKSILVQFRWDNSPQMQVIYGELDPTPVFQESGLKYQLTLGRNQNSGLFLDMKNGRDWVRQNATNKKVLNLFSYTCGFSVAAMAGGAGSVVNVDMAKGALATGKRNHQLNELDTSRVKFFGHDIFKSWGKIKKSGPYDLVIIDPPSFQKGSFALTKDYQKILRRLDTLMNSEGKVLACVNSPAVSSDFLLQGMQENAPNFHFQYRIDNPIEFQDIDQEASLKCLVFENSTSEPNQQ